MSKRRGEENPENLDNKRTKLDEQFDDLLKQAQKAQKEEQDDATFKELLNKHGIYKEKEKGSKKNSQELKAPIEDYKQDPWKLQKALNKISKELGELKACMENFMDELQQPNPKPKPSSKGATPLDNKSQDQERQQ